MRSNYNTPCKLIWYQSKLKQLELYIQFTNLPTVLRIICRVVQLLSRVVEIDGPIFQKQEPVPWSISSLSLSGNLQHGSYKSLIVYFHFIERILHCLQVNHQSLLRFHSRFCYEIKWIDWIYYHTNGDLFQSLLVNHDL